MNRLLLSIIALVFLLPTCRPAESRRKLKVVASTALIGTIVQTVGDGKVQVTTIAPAGICPGHFDITPQALAAVYDAQLVLYHGWEGWMEKLKEEAKKSASTWTVLKTKGNWMVPPVQHQATEELTTLLIHALPGESLLFAKNCQRYQTQIDSVATLIKSLFTARRLPRVVASEHQADFLKWLGFNVVGTYRRPEDFTARELSSLAQVMIDSSVGLVVDNLQSGPDAGRPFAEAARVSHITLSNFPLEGDYLETVLDNARALIKVIE
ncbi:MAG: metal ABC transporter substrate-binding protein [bacterium]